MTSQGVWYTDAHSCCGLINAPLRFSDPEGQQSLPPIGIAYVLSALD